MFGLVRVREAGLLVEDLVEVDPVGGGDRLGQLPTGGWKMAISRAESSWFRAIQPASPPVSFVVSSEYCLASAAKSAPGAFGLVDDLLHPVARGLPAVEELDDMPPERGLDRRQDLVLLESVREHSVAEGLVEVPRE